MKVTCDKCGASYKIPADKLTRDVSKATCKKCGNKIIIRSEQKAEEPPEPPRSAFLQEPDPGVSHDERTIITAPEELESFGASGPLKGGILNPMDLENRGMQARTGPLSPASPLQSAPPAPAPSPVFNVPGANTGSMQRPDPAPGSTTGTVGAASSQAPVFASGGKKADVADIFRKQQEAREAEAAQSAPPPSPLPLVFMGVALLGLLLFLPKGLWMVQAKTMLGFVLALYGILASIMTHREFSKTGEVNMVKAFVLPLLPVAAFVGFWLVSSAPAADDTALDATTSEAAPAGATTNSSAEGAPAAPQ